MASIRYVVGEINLVLNGRSFKTGTKYRGKANRFYFLHHFNPNPPHLVAIVEATPLLELPPSL